jgi:hypothetical protein
MGAPQEEDEYRPGQTITEQPRPRVLLLRVDDKTLAARLADKIPTLAAVDHLAGVDLHEWDCIVTNHEYTSLKVNQPPRRSGYSFHEDEDAKTFTWGQHLPDHISVVFAPTSERGIRRANILDFQPRTGKEQPSLPLVVIIRDNMDGQHVSYVEGLPLEIADVVKERLVPIARKRTSHTIYEVRSGDYTGERDLRLRPFLFGPRHTPLAGSYERTDKASVWLLPEDIGDLAPWVLAALRDWHSLYPERFPGIPEWTTDSKYRSSAEERLHEDLKTRTEAIQAEVQKFLAEKEGIESRLSAAAEEAARYERALLTGQDEELAQAIARALRDLGFAVRDMDEEWEPGKRREDYRITDPDEVDWIAVGEAKGFTKGMRETGLLSLGRWAGMFAVEEKRLPSGQWYVANHYLRQDPEVRPDPLATRSDVLKAFIESDGLVIDTRALYVLLRAVQDEPTLAPAVRQRLREARGVLRARDAASLLIDVRKPTT